MQQIIADAQQRGCLAYKVLDQNLQSCGGGKFDWRPYLPTDSTPGPWLPEIKETSECSQGYHLTLDPLAWNGCVVFLAETPTAMKKTDKQVFPTCRLLRRIWPDECLEVRLWVRCKYPFLYGANLSGANLSGTNLSGANLNRADLSEANLYRANLYRANLSGANLYRANLYEANLNRANLYGTYLYEADLSEAKLNRADLSEANLYRANLYGTYLYEADLNRANLYGTYLYRAYRHSTDAKIPGWRLNGGFLERDE